ncbi:hypothetical protein [Flavobacterium sp. HBTb2-11-1]|uniref:hypothetical protein n=1 Tax=Flavobacterium sp. HBTb2-11-1 TaxID=2692212 RepID=UPI00136B872F|nr:hypothetical protein [Flavobacterium sp. HBTb2-11-1]MXO03504.1 hypothetical protein [Flavobacterium sp. HBTb2-11-1]
MATNDLSEETEKRLKDFFIDVIDTKDMAKAIREVNYVLSLCSLRGCETIESEVKNIDDSFYWLNRLAEALDPYLEID